MESNYYMWIVVYTILISSTISQSYDYSYYSDNSDADSECPVSADDVVVACQRYTSCTKCPDTVTNCYCDSACVYYGDCCADAVGRSQKATVDPETVSCQKKVMNNARVDVAVIDRCPAGANPDSVNNCQNPDIALLVRGDVNGLIYANRYCALCNGEGESTPLLVEVQCFPPEANLARNSQSVQPTADSISVILYRLLTVGSYTGVDKSSCYLHYKALDENNQETYRSCNPDVVSSCPLSMADTDKDKECKEGPVNHVYEHTRSGKIGNIPYRNEKCAECHNIKTYGCKPPAKTSTAPFYRGLSSLVDLNALSCVRREVMAGSNRLTEANRCDEGKFKCPIGQRYKPMNGCVQDDDNSVGNPPIENCLKSSNSSEYVERDGIVEIPHLNLSSSEYKIVDGQAFICVVKGTGASSETENTRSIGNPVLTAVLLSLSLLCILGQLVLYSVFRALRNIPGLILICLCIAMFVSEAVFLATIFIKPSPQVCSSFAVIQHYFFLATFFWTNVMSFDVTRMLTVMSPTASSSTKKFVLYNVYAWTIPAIFVGAALIAEYNGGGIVPAYGAEGCWFSTKHGLLIYFLAPIFVILTANLICYIISISAIVKAARQTKLANPDLKERLYLAIKLVAVMGLPWIISVFAAYIDSVALDYIFVILNASQGILIFVCYVFSKRVLNLIKTGGEYSRSRRSSNNQTSTFSIRSRKSNYSIGSRTSANYNSSIVDEKSQTRRSEVERPTNLPIAEGDDYNQSKNESSTQPIGQLSPNDKEGQPSHRVISGKITTV